MGKVKDMDDYIRGTLSFARQFEYAQMKHTSEFLYDLADYLKSLPLPVVHGSWEKKTEWDEDDNAIFECTNCLHGDVQAKGAVVPYCWHCGAKMDGKKVEE